MASHLPGCKCESCERTQRYLDEFAREATHEVKNVQVGEISVTLFSNGKINIGGPSIMTRPLTGLTKEEVLDLVVALDGVTNDQPPTKDETMLHKIRTILQETEHKLYKLGVRHRIEIHTNHWNLMEIASEADAPVQQPRQDTRRVLLGAYGTLVAVRGKTI